MRVREAVRPTEPCCLAAEVPSARIRAGPPLPARRRPIGAGRGRALPPPPHWPPPRALAPPGPAEGGGRARGGRGAGTVRGGLRGPGGGDGGRVPSRAAASVTYVACAAVPSPSCGAACISWPGSRARAAAAPGGAAAGAAPPRSRRC